MINFRFFRLLRWCLHLIDRCLAYSLILLIYLIRPMLGPMNICPFIRAGKQEGCTQFAIHQLKTENMLRACWNIVRRLLTCHPIR